ncbi:MAG TPA: hypothetical protein VFM18_21820 [Methanosarcina sp.]|nr:hypothetical protein [Methanosarcina sp.]
MTEILQQALLKLIEATSNGVDKAISFLSTEIPEVIRQLLVWKFAESLAYCLAAIALIIIWMVIDYKIFKVAKNSKDHEALFFGWGLCGCLYRGVFVTAISSLFNLTWLKIWIAPKIYLIEYAAELAKAMK